AQLAAKSKEDVRQDALYRLVQIAVEEKAWSDVAKYAALLRQQFPKGRYDWEAAFQLGQAQLQQGLAEQAVRTLQRVVEQRDDPRVRGATWYPHAWVLLAEAYFQRKDYEKVATCAQAFTRDFPDSPVRYRMDHVLGRALKRQARFDEAREAFRRVVESVPGRRTETAAQAQLMIAETYFLQKNYQKALLEYLKVYHLYAFPEWQAAGLFQAGLCDEMLGNWSDAAKTYELLLSRFPKSDLVGQAETRLARIRKRSKASKN
ncbi:MAG TPA: tetratricopeptide repeat protein, partial [Planctomycetaceae bacterium]|nr:tetratricopeptide repeat protein [Planctomycetaceae bacterium]